MFGWMQRRALLCILMVLVCVAVAHAQVAPDSAAVAEQGKAAIKDTFGLVGTVFANGVVAALMLLGFRVKKLLAKLEAGWAKFLVPILAVVVSTVLLKLSEFVPFLNNSALQAWLNSYLSWIGLGAFTGAVAVGLHSGVKNMGQGAKTVIGG